MMKLISDILPIISTILGGVITDKDQKHKLLKELEHALVREVSKAQVETIKTNQIEARHRSVWVAGWRPAIGWSLAFGIFWMLVGQPIASWAAAVSGTDVPLPELPKEILFELTLAMLGMGAIRSFDKLKNLTK